MKMKSFAMLAVSGLLASCIAYSVPALAEDTNNDAQSLQSPDNSMPNQNGAQDSTNPAQDYSSNGANNNNNNNTTEEGTPDTATGDDDY